MWSYMLVDVRAYDHQSKYTSEHEINKASEHTSTWAFKPQSTHASYHSITLGVKHNHKNVWAYERPTTWSPKPPSLFTYYHPSVCTCVRVLYEWISMLVWKRLSKHLNVGAYKHQIIERYKHEILKASGHVIVKVCRRGSIWPSKHVIIKEVC